MIITQNVKDQAYLFVVGTKSSYIYVSSYTIEMTKMSELETLR